MNNTLIAAALLLGTNAAYADAVKYELDPSHSQIVFSYNHLGFSTTYGMFSGFGGEVMFDQEAPANSSVSVAMSVMSMMTGWEKRFDHFMAADFFGADDADEIRFVSTGIEVTGEATALITGDLSLNGVTRAVILDAKLNQNAGHPMKDGQPWLGFDATTTLKRTDFDLGKFAPFVSDEVEVLISIEAGQAG